MLAAMPSVAGKLTSLINTETERAVLQITDAIATMRAAILALADRTGMSTARSRAPGQLPSGSTPAEPEPETMAAIDTLHAALDTITGLLQFQDSTRQISEHSLQLLAWTVAEVGNAIEPLCTGSLNPEIQAQAIERLHRKAGSVFSVPSEWEGFGLKHDKAVKFQKL